LRLLVSPKHSISLRHRVLYHPLEGVASVSLRHSRILPHLRPHLLLSSHLLVIRRHHGHFNIRHIHHRRISHHRIRKLSHISLTSPELPPRYSSTCEPLHKLLFPLVLPLSVVHIERLTVNTLSVHFLFGLLCVFMVVEANESKAFTFFFLSNTFWSVVVYCFFHHLRAHYLSKPLE